MKANDLYFSRLIAERIRQLRRSKDYSQQFMADGLGISQNAYSKLESGKTPIHLARLCELSVLLDIDAHQLLEEAFSNQNSNSSYAKQIQ
jgi:transcriptional regulator with XRE-family HTH domain